MVIVTQGNTLKKEKGKGQSTQTSDQVKSLSPHQDFETLDDYFLQSLSSTSKICSREHLLSQDISKYREAVLQDFSQRPESSKSQ